MNIQTQFGDLVMTFQNKMNAHNLQCYVVLSKGELFQHQDPFGFPKSHKND